MDQGPRDVPPPPTLSGAARRQYRPSIHKHLAEYADYIMSFIECVHLHFPTSISFTTRWNYILTVLMLFDVQLRQGPLIEVEQPPCEECQRYGGRCVAVYNSYFLHYKGYTYTSTSVIVRSAIAANLKELAASNPLSRTLVHSKFWVLRPLFRMRRPFPSLLDNEDFLKAQDMAKRIVLGETDE